MIYLLEDDDSIRKLVIYALESQQFPAEGFSEAESFWSAMAQHTPSLILLDIMLPGEDGISVLRRLRLTAKNTEYDRVQGLDAGADDYISKPFGMMELVARVRAVLRRTEPSRESAEYRVGELYVCPDRHEARLSGKQIQLTYKEFLLLCTLLENRGKIVSRDALMLRLWNDDCFVEENTLTVNVTRLRRKLEAHGLGATIVTRPGSGYIIP